MNRYHEVDLSGAELGEIRRSGGVAHSHADAEIVMDESEDGGDRSASNQSTISGQKKKQNLAELQPPLLSPHSQPSSSSGSSRPNPIPKWMRGPWVQGGCLILTLILAVSLGYAAGRAGNSSRDDSSASSTPSLPLPSTL